MKFIKQTGMEIKNILMSKFLLIIGILIFAISIAAPLISVFSAKAQDDMYYPMPIGPVYAAKESYYGGYYYDYEEPPVTVDGVVIEADNPFFWNIKDLMFRIEEEDGSWFKYPESFPIMQELLDIELDYYVRLAQTITSHYDYRLDIAWYGQSIFRDKYIFEKATTANIDALKEAAGYGTEDKSFDEKYVDITPPQRFAAIDALDDQLETLYRIVEQSDFPAYISFQIEQQQKNITDYEKMIEIHVKQIAENPGQEEMLSEQIKYIQRDIDYIKESAIPMLQYRLEKNIIPRDGSWQNTAISNIEEADNNLRWTEILSEENFNKEPYLKMQYGTYARYRDDMQMKLDGFNEIKMIARNSIDADMPDMKYVPSGARSQTAGFLFFSTFVALFAVIIGGWMIASEFQLGTIRLLMIRPRTRIKILMSKFAAGLLICLMLYIAGSLINLLMNGICFGFSDFGYPNFTASGQVGFIAYYLPKLLACMLPIVFGFCVAFMLSTVVKNIAVSIAVPVVCFIGCVILNMLVLGRSWGGVTGWDWIVWTPVPYVQLSDFFVPSSSINMMKQYGYGLPYNMGYGMGLLAALSAVSVFISGLIFRKQDITH